MVYEITVRTGGELNPYQVSYIQTTILADWYLFIVSSITRENQYVHINITHLPFICILWSACCTVVGTFTLCAATHLFSFYCKIALCDATLEGNRSSCCYYGRSGRCEFLFNANLLLRFKFVCVICVQLHAYMLCPASRIVGVR